MKTFTLLMVETAINHIFPTWNIALKTYQGNIILLQPFLQESLWWDDWASEKTGHGMIANDLLYFACERWQGGGSDKLFYWSEVPAVSGSCSKTVLMFPTVFVETFAVLVQQHSILNWFCLAHIEQSGTSVWTWRLSHTSRYDRQESLSLQNLQTSGQQYFPVGLLSFCCFLLDNLM